MNTLTDIAYEHDRLVKPGFAVDDIGDFGIWLNAGFEGKASDQDGGQYYVRVPKEQTRSGEMCRLGFALPENQAHNPTPSDLADGHMNCARDIARLYNCASSEPDPARGETAIQSRQNWPIILALHGYETEEDLQMSPYKIVGLESSAVFVPGPLQVDEGPFHHRALLDYSLVKKNTTSFHFNVDAEMVVAQMGYKRHGGFPLADMGVVLEQVAYQQPSVSFIMPEHRSQRQWQGSMIIKCEDIDRPVSKKASKYLAR